MKKIHYDYLRVLNMLGIIGIHCTAPFVSEPIDTSSFFWWYGSFLQHLVRIALPLFFMLSGALALDKDYPSLTDYYKKRVIKILIPFFIYCWFYALLHYDFHWGNLLSLLSFYLRAVISGNESHLSYHFWFIYSIMGLYLCTPFLAKMLRNLSIQHFTALIVLMIVVQGLQLYPPMVGISIKLDDFIFSGWVIYYILGYYLSRPEVFRRLSMRLFGGGFFIALAATEVIWWWYPRFSNHMYDLSYTMIWMACTIFLWFEKHASSISALPDTLHKVISWISSYSFSIYLIHAMVLSELVGTRMNITIHWSNYLISSVLRIVLVFLFSLVISIFVDTILVKPIQKLCSYFLLSKPVSPKNS